MNERLYYLIQYYEKRYFCKMFKFGLIPKSELSIKMYDIALKYCARYEMNIKSYETIQLMNNYITEFGVYELREFTRLQSITRKFT